MLSIPVVKIGWCTGGRVSAESPDIAAVEIILVVGTKQYNFHCYKCIPFLKSVDEDLES